MNTSRTEAQRSNCLVVEDDDEVAFIVENILERSGFGVRRAPDGETAVGLCKESRPDIVILDLHLPGIDGHETAKELREISDAYILMLSGKGTLDDKVDALSSSVDDYLQKPFSQEELVARVQALLRRPRGFKTAPEAPARIVVNSLNRTITVDEKQLTLTALEYELLSILVEFMPDLVEKERLIARGWGDPKGASPHILNVHVHNLRRKLTAADDDVIIESVRGLGFRIYDRKS